jgi:tRNA(Ile)-lysidine synthase
MLYSQVEYILQQIFPSGLTKPLIIGVSGGPDSSCLLDILNRLGYPLIIAHLNHGLRVEADAEADLVGQVGKNLGIKVILGKEDVPAFAQQNKLSIEEAARVLRYRFLFTQAIQIGAQAVAVAHSADDQVETMMMHLLRGTGLSGLKGMSIVALPNSWSEDIALIRPLLSSWRQEIVQYCQDRDLHPIQDKSNQDTSYYRNRLRHELIPYLESYNPQVRKALWRTAQTLAADEEMLEEAVGKVWGECVVDEGPGYAAFRYTVLVGQSKGMQRRLFRQGLNRVKPGLRDVDYETVERAVGFIANPARTAYISLSGGCYLLLEGDRLWLAGWDAYLPGFEWPQLPGGAAISLDVPGEIELPHGWSLKADLVCRSDLPRSFSTNTDAFTAWLSFERLKLPLLIRARRPGDRFQPLGMLDRKVKLSDLMINAKLPRRARSAWPLVYSDETIVWVPGHAISNAVRIDEDTQQVVIMRLHRRPDVEEMSDFSRSG